MDTEIILNELNKIFRKELNDDTITLNRATTADDVEEWDSLTHIQLIVSIEKKFKIKFTSAEIQEFKNIGEVVDAISKRVS